MLRHAMLLHAVRLDCQVSECLPAGLGVGLEATALPVLVMSCALIAAYWLGNSSGGWAGIHRFGGCLVERVAVSAPDRSAALD